MNLIIKGDEKMKEHIEKILNSKIKAFLPTVLAKKLNKTVEEVVKELENYVKEGKLQVKTMLLCEKCERTYKEIDGIHKKEYFEEEGYCEFCGNDFEENPLVNGGVKYYVVKNTANK